MNMRRSWQRSSHSELQVTLVDKLMTRIEAVFAPHADSIDLGHEDGIPTIELSMTVRLMSFAQAVKLAQLAMELFDCPVHFHELRSHSVIFFVFHEDLNHQEPYGSRLIAEYGTPVDAWLRAMTAEPLPVLAPVIDHDMTGPNPPSMMNHREGLLFTTHKGFRSNNLSGKWCVNRTADTVDALWKAVRDLVLQGQYKAALVSTPANARKHGDLFVICLFTTNWRDEAAVMAAREDLRALGVTENIGYKRDIETFNDVYGGAEEWTYRA